MMKATVKLNLLYTIYGREGAQLLLGSMLCNKVVSRPIDQVPVDSPGVVALKIKSSESSDSLFLVFYNLQVDNLLLVPSCLQPFLQYIMKRRILVTSLPPEVGRR